MIGQLKSINLDFPNLKGPSDEIELNNVTLLCGANGTGKTLINIFSWIGCTFVSIKLDFPSAPYEVLDMFIKYSLNNFTETGSFKVEFTSGVILDVYLENGKVSKLDLLNTKEGMEGTRALYMSTEMRLYTNIARYIKIRKGQSDMMKMLSDFDYKIYDAMVCEKIISTLSDGPFDVSDLDFAKFDVLEKYESLELDDDSNILLTYIDQEGIKIKKNVTEFGNGHQAIINMLTTPKIYNS